MTDSSREFIGHMIAAVVGIEIRIVNIVGKWKLGQNKDQRDRLAAAHELQAHGNDVASAAMLATLEPSN
jgi:transcriptional regulator